MADSVEPGGESRLGVDTLRDVWPALSPEDRVEAFRRLPAEDADEFFLSLSEFGQATIIGGLPPGQRRLWARLLAPDDMVDVLQEFDEPMRGTLLGLLDEQTRREVSALMAYAEDDAGGLMSPRFARVRPDATVGESIRYLRQQAQHKVETIYSAYVLDAAQHLLGVVSFRQLFSAADSTLIRDMMEKDVISVHEEMDQEAVAKVMARFDLAALPVIDQSGCIKGIVTVDDIVDVVTEEATEDIQKMGGMEALEAPYLQTSLFSMVKKRAGWLSALFIGEMLTATAMGHFEGEIAKLVVLALFIPLIISSGGNSGSQATTLVIRAMALGEVKLRDWWRVIRREFASGLALGAVLAVIGLCRILIWQHFHLYDYGPDYFLVAATVSLSLLGVVAWGTLCGAMLPFILRRLGFDPASASAPFVATVVDVSGLIIYFSIAGLIFTHQLH